MRIPYLLISAIGLGCISAPIQVPDPTTSTVSDTAPATTPRMTPLSFTYSDGRFHYDLQQTTVIAVGTPDNISAEDTILTRASFIYSISTVDGTPAFSATVDSLVVMSSRDSVLPARYLLMPVTVEFPFISEALFSPEDSAAFRSTCDTMDSAARALVADIHVQLPVPMEPGQNWTDSSSVLLCRGGIPMTIVALSSFRVLDLPSTGDGRPIGVRRQTNLILGGSGTEGTRRISVTGRGTSEALFIYGRQEGRLVESTGQSLLELDFETIQQTERVVQRSSSHVFFRAGQSR